VKFYLSAGWLKP